MYRNEKKKRWEATEPIHLIGWIIVATTTERDRRLFKMILESTNGKQEKRECWVDIEIVPSEVTQRSYRK